jgi:hypothetical protein
MGFMIVVVVVYVLFRVMRKGEKGTSNCHHSKISIHLQSFCSVLRSERRYVDHDDDDDDERVDESTNKSKDEKSSHLTLIIAHHLWC